jgi:D-tyrosyl-tRNA(Tyr) deacylase
MPYFPFTVGEIYTLLAGTVNVLALEGSSSNLAVGHPEGFQKVDLWIESHENQSTMRAIVQRVSRAEVEVAGVTIASIGAGILALVAISNEDTEKDLLWMARKIAELRIFNDDHGKLNLSLQDINGQLLVVSQFTLYGDCRKGRRPSYTEAAPPLKAEKLYQEFVNITRQFVPDVQTGQFQASMEVMLTNSGPVTLILDSHQ